MSLVYFHIVLMTAGTLFFFGFGFWEFSHFSDSKAQFDLFVSVLSFIFSLGLASYLFWFIKKKKPQLK